MKTPAHLWRHTLARQDLSGPAFHLKPRKGGTGNSTAHYTHMTYVRLFLHELSGAAIQAGFLAQSMHQPLALIWPSTNLQVLVAAMKFMHVAQL